MPRVAADLTGRRFERLVVVRPSACGKHRWDCVCDCGAEKSVNGYLLLKGDTKSCGCYSRDQSRTRLSNLKHGLSKSPTYNSWAKMKERCGNSASVGYASYGGRGITVCDRWQDFANFLADMGERPNGMTLDRKDGNLGYEPNNCRWATKLEQANNTRTNRRIVVDGRLVTVAEASRQTGISTRTIQYRLNHGLSFDRRPSI